MIFIIILSSVRDYFVKNFLQNKIDKVIPGFKITYFKSRLNNTFTLSIQKQNNIVRIYGNIYPLNALFDANFQNISKIYPKFRGKMILHGTVIKKNNHYLIKGIAYFADGYLNYNATFNRNLYVKAKGKDFNIQKLLYMLKIDYPYIDGVTDLNIEKNKNIIITAKTKGNIKKDINTKFNAVTKIKKDMFIKIYSNINSELGNITLSSQNLKNKYINNINAKDINLSYLHSVLIYPFKGLVDFVGSYNGRDKIFKFYNKKYEGFMTNHIEITFQMKSDKFSKYVNISNFLKGDVSGIIIIHKKTGSFDIVSKNNVFVKNSFTHNIYKLTGIKLYKYKLKNIFIKGNFDQNKTVFNLLSDNDDLSMNIQQGIFTYSGKIEIVLFIRKDNIEYKILIKNNKYKLINKRNLNDHNNKILVF